MSISILGMGYSIPEGVLDNKSIIERYIDALGKNLNKDDKEFLRYSIEKKLEFLRIERRHYCRLGSHENSVSLAVDAAEKAIKNANIPIEEIDAVICTGVTNPFREPTFATVIAHMIGLKTANVFDISDTCNGFMKCIELTDLYLNSNSAKNVLVVACENGISALDNKKSVLEVDNVDEADYKVSSLFAGTSAAAAVYTKATDSKKVLFYEEYRSFDEWDSSVSMFPKVNMEPFSRMSKHSNVFWSDGRKIASKIISDMPDFINEVLDKHGINKDKIKYVFTHQLGRNVTFSVLNSIKLDKEKMFPVNTFVKYGNMGSCNIPIAIEIANEKGLLEAGDEILLLSSACGLTFSVSYVIW